MSPGTIAITWTVADRKPIPPMPALSRRSFVKYTAAVAAGAALAPRSWAQSLGANGEVRLAIVGLNGKGRDHLRSFHAISGVRVVALCDVDTAVLARAKTMADEIGAQVETCVDLRDLLERRDIDAVAIVTPNHLHALQAIWAMEAGKDVCIEKPVSHNLWEGRQLIAAAQKYGRIVQVNTQNRSSVAIAEALAWMHDRPLGKVTCVRGLCYKRRPSIGRTTSPTAVPATVNYDLFLGPAPMEPLHRTNLHYDWHWQWATGNGDIVAQGNHQLDVGRRFLGDPGHPARVLTVGGRFGYRDDGETPNTLLVTYDYEVPFIFEVRGLPAKPDEASGDALAPSGLGASSRWAANMDKYRGMSVGNLVECEGGHLVIPAGDYALVRAFDQNGKLLREFKGADSHYANFIAAVRSRKEADLHAPILQGHLSSALAHLANISYRAGRALQPDEVREQIRGDAVLTEAYGRFTEHLAANAVNFEQTPAQLGAPLTFDAATEMFTGENNAAANAQRTREYRAPFVVPALA
jgi:Oxidoreductase family, NAD-binding Rossmann fold/Oxidoreductase family, C-terminal alpha/beta domain